MAEDMSEAEFLRVTGGIYDSWWSGGPVLHLFTSPLK